MLVSTFPSKTYSVVVKTLPLWWLGQGSAKTTKLLWCTMVLQKVLNIDSTKLLTYYIGIAIKIWYFLLGYQYCYSYSFSCIVNSPAVSFSFTPLF